MAFTNLPITTADSALTGAQGVAAIESAAATKQTLAAAITFAQSGLMIVGGVVKTLEYNTGTGIGGNSYKLVDGATSRPTADGGSVIHVTGGSGFLYLSGLFNNGQVDITQLGAVGGDETKDSLAWVNIAQIAESKNLKIIIPKLASNYHVNYPLYSFNNMQMQIDGVVENIRVANDLYGDNFCIFFGNVTETGFTDATAYNCNAISEKSVVCTLPTATDSDNFTAGDIVVLYSTESVTFGANPRPDFQMLNEVVSVTSGQLELKYPLKESLGGAQPKVANMNDTGQVDTLGGSIKCVKDITISGSGGFKSRMERWTGFGGALRARINLNYVEAEDILSVNGFAFSEVDISGVFYSGGYELAYFAHDSSFKCSKGITFKNASLAADTAIVVASEQARRLSFDYITAATTTDYLPEYLLTSTGAHSIVFNKNINITANASTALVNASGVGGGVFSGGVFDGFRIKGDAPVAVRVIDNASTLSNVNLYDLNLDGTYSAFSFNINSSSIVMRNCYHKTGNINIQSGCNKVSISGMASDSTRLIVDAGTATVKYNNYTTEKSNSVDGRFVYATILDDDVFTNVLYSAGAIKVGKVSWTAGGNLNNRGTIHYNYGSPACVSDTGVTGSAINTATGVLTGTTGTDAKITASVDTAGNFYLENRSGVTLFVAIEIN